MLSALFLAGGLGEIQPPAAGWLGLTGLAGYAWLSFKMAQGWSAVRTRLLAAIIVAGAVAAFLPQQGYAVLMAPAVVSALRLARTFRPVESQRIDRHLLWSALFALSSVVYRAEPYCRAFVDAGCRTAGEFVAMVLQQPWAPASTALGWQALTAYVLLIAVTVPSIARGARLTAIIAAVAMLVASVSLYAVSATLLAHFYRASAHYASLPDPGEMTHAGQHHVAPFTWITPIPAMYPMSCHGRQVDIQRANRKLRVKLQAGKPIERIASNQFFEGSIGERTFLRPLANAASRTAGLMRQDEQPAFQTRNAGYHGPTFKCRLKNCIICPGASVLLLPAS